MPSVPTATGIAIAALAALAAASGATVAASVVTAAPASAANVTTVKAVETDFHIALSKNTFKAGRYVFVAQNKGHTTHALMITGPGITMAMTKDIQPGQSAKLAVTFKKGPYDIYCPIPGHKALGMNVNVTVGGATTTTAKGTNSAGGDSTSGASSGGGSVSF